MSRSRATRPSHRPSLGQISRILPEAGSKEARLLSHILQCDLCADAALSVLAIGNRAVRGTTALPSYDAAFSAATAQAARIYELSTRALALAERLFRLPDAEARRRRAHDLARIEPRSVTLLLLEAGKALFLADPNRASEVAELAMVAAQEVDPEEQGLELLAEAHDLLLESLGRVKDQADEATAEAVRQFSKLAGLDPLSRRPRRSRGPRLLAGSEPDLEGEPRSPYFNLLSLLRRVEGNAEEVNALLDRAEALLGEGDPEDFGA